MTAPRSLALPAPKGPAASGPAEPDSPLRRTLLGRSSGSAGTTWRFAHLAGTCWRCARLAPLAGLAHPILSPAGGAFAGLAV